MFAHPVRHERVTHVVLNFMPNPPRRDRGHFTLCGRQVSQAFQRVVSDDFHPAAITCERCLNSFNGFVELCDRAEAIGRTDAEVRILYKLKESQ